MNDGSVVAGTSDAFDLALNPKYNNGLPLVVYSPDGGATWRPDDATPIKLGNNLGIFAPSRNTSPTSIGDTPLPLDKRTAACATARDEINDDVYVAFAGCDNPNAGTDRNTDIYIFRSEPGTAGKVWRDPITGQQQEGREYIRITDAMLGVPAGSIKSWGPDQMVPAIAIDCTGAICLTYYDNRNDANGTPYTNNRVDVYFTRVHGLGSGTVTIDPPVVLTSSTFPLGGSDLTDFGSLAVAGTTSRVVYPAYMARKLNSNGTWSNPVCFVHKITMNQCIGDPGDGFSAAYAQQIEDAILVGDPQGDIYEDQSVDIDDFILLQQWKETAGIP